MLSKRAHLRSGGVESAGFNNATLPFVAVELELGERSHMADRFGLCKVRLVLDALKLLQRSLFRRVSPQRIFVSDVRRRPQSILQRKRIVVSRCQFERTVTARTAAVHCVVANANRYANDALVIIRFLGKRAVVCNRLVAADVVETILNKIRLLHTRQQNALFPVKLLQHRSKEGVISGR